MSKSEITKIAQKTHAASQELSAIKTTTKNKILKEIASALIKNKKDIMKVNAKDVNAAKKKGLNAALIDRLVLDEKRIKGMRDAVMDVAKLPDPVGEITEKRKKGKLTIEKMRIPLGVICMIYESRPNVTVDAATLCFKSGNAVILRGGSEAFHSNRYLVSLIQAVLKKNKLSPHIVSMVPQTDRKAMIDLLKLDQFIELVIPRGGEGLMKFIGEHTRIPVIKHDKGVCSIFIDESAPLKNAIEIVINAKVQRPGVCNALESLYVHQKVACKVLPDLCAQLESHGVEIRGDDKVRKTVKDVKKVKEKEFGEEYLDLILSIKVVKDVNDAINNIQKYSSRHTESILTKNKKNAALNVSLLNSSCVMVNTSTRFNDGGELGLGAEIGIATTKLHAYGPMGLKELTTTKFVVNSNYSVRT